MSKIFEVFQRWKLQQTRPPTAVSFRPIPDCVKCCHLKKQEVLVDAEEVLYGVCNISMANVTNRHYPWQCSDFYTGMDD